MVRRRLLLFFALLWVSGCLYYAKERTDRTVCDLAARPYDLRPPDPPESQRPPPAAGAGTGTAATEPAFDVQTTALMQPEERGPHGGSADLEARVAIQPIPGKDATLEAIRKRQERLKIPEAVPGSETPPIQLPREAAARARAIQQLYPPLPPLPEEPKPLPGPNGQPYTLAELQQLAAANSPQLRQAAADVEAARGNLIQAATYPNPTVGLEVDPSNDGSTPGVWGGFVDQVIKTGGKLKLQAAAAEMDLRNAELALRRARSDLATQVRNAYYAVLVAQETVRVLKALARFTDEVYLVHGGLLQGGFAAPYEPAALRAQTWTVRLSLKQAIATHIFAWKQLVAAVGLRQLPLSQVAGRIDRAIPYYDYDAVRAHVLSNHTDVLTARNVVSKAHYNLMLAQITPAYPDVEFRAAVLKEFVVPPQQVVPTAQVSIPLPIWDKNKGNIMAAEAAWVRASDEPHRVELTLTANLTTAYMNYKNNLEALEYYRRFILPDQVRTYRGIFERRQTDQAFGFVDLVTAQQTLTTNVTSYLAILGQLWTSVVSVADLLQTDDLFQVAHPQDLPPLPDLEALPPWLCEHPCSLLAPVPTCGMTANH
jgi:cobalt-zinc-cadmium efflux system outer membrane protein